MIIRERQGSFVLIRQHDHGQISGEFARHWRSETLPQRPTLFAIANHDVGWEELDDEVKFNPATSAPYSFIDYPLEPKLRAYKHGLDQVEAQEPYASYLGSLHYASFVRDSRETAAVDFKNEEGKRRERLEERLPEEWLRNAEYNFRLLQLCDDLSLFVCLNEPGVNAFPWYRDGFEFRGERLMPIWDDENTLSLAPNPFTEPFDVTIPHHLVGKDGKVIENGNFRLRVAG